MKLINLTDSDARKMISTKTDINLFVEASAGSGKTTSLVNRMVALVEKGVPVNQICTITFTVAAADEFFERFQKLLSKRTVDDLDNPDLGPTTETSKARCLEALNNIDSCFSGTMDSFCNMVAHELPNELDIPSDAEIISEQEKQEILFEELFKVLINPLHPLNKEADRFMKTFRYPFDAFLKGINEVFDYRDYQIAYGTDYLDESSDSIIVNEINDFIDLIKLIKSDGLEYIGNASIKDKTKALTDVVNRLNTNWKDNIQLFNYALSKFSKDTKYSLEVEGSKLETDYLVSNGRSYVYSDEILQEIDHILEVINEYSFQVYFSFIDKIKEEIAINMKKNAKFTFFDFLYYLTKKFQEDSKTPLKELVSHVYSRHSHILIDESQDTNPMQTQLFFYLTGLTSSDNWELVEPRPGSLFIVGDPKQSIYSFRGADVKAYNHVKDVFSNIGDVILLKKNFRSNRDLREYFNQIMNKVLDIGDEPLIHPDIPLDPETEKGKIRQELESSKKVTLNGVYKYDTSRKKKEDAMNVVNIIKKIVNNDNYQIISKASNEIRKIQYKDILIITRGKKVPEYIEAFANNQIPLRVEAKIYFSNSPSVDILKKLLYLLFEPFNKRYFVDVVTSDLYKLDTSDIIQMVNDGFSLNISDINNIDDSPIRFSNSRHQEIIDELHQLYLDSRDLSVSSTLFYLLSNSKLNFFKNISSEFLDYAYYMVELVKEAEISGDITSFYDARNFLENSISNDSDIEKIMKFSNNVNQVKISNLHKVKGLQAPVVILAAPHVMKFPQNKYVDRDNKKIYFSSISIDNGFGNQLTICESRRYDKELEKADLESESEGRRVEYVAATRAESVLIIGKPDKVNGGYVNQWNELLTDELTPIPEYEEQESNIDVVNYDEAMKKYHPVVNLESHNKSYVCRSPSEYRIRTNITNIDVVDEIVDIDISKALLGTIVHILLECLVNSRNYFDIPKLVESILKEYGYNDKELSELLIRVANSYINSDLFKKLLNSKEVLCEVPFSYKKGNTIVSGIIDLLYLDESGYHIIDYKTNLESDIKVLESEYQNQLRVYQKALKNATGLDSDAHIYHIEIK